MTDCCNDKCNQGRACPAKVAPVKCSYPRDNEYYNMWAEDMRLIATCAFTAIMFILFIFMGILAFVLIN